jgi:large subunit ribosomal protein L24
MPGVDVKKDDLVRVVAGKDRGKEGRVVRVLPSEGRVMVDGVAMAKRHTRTTGKRSRRGTQQLQQGGIIDIETFVDISNVQIICPSCGKATRVGHRAEGDRKVRICRKCEAEL